MEEKVKNVDYSAEDTLTGVATFVLIAGIIATLVCACTIVVIRDPSYTYIDEYIFNPEGFAITLGVLLSTLISWASMKVLANISCTLKKINSKIKE